MVLQANALIGEDVTTGDAVPVEINFGAHGSRPLAYPVRTTVAIR